MGGKLAVEFAALIQGLEASESRSLSPQMFKSTVGRFEPRFAGFQQHDAQEFMSRVLEGLGDELNRVLVKEYHELPASDDKLYAQHALGVSLAAGELKKAGASLANTAVVICARHEVLNEAPAILGVLPGAADHLPQRIFMNI